MLKEQGIRNAYRELLQQRVVLEQLCLPQPPQLHLPEPALNLELRVPRVPALARLLLFLPAVMLLPLVLGGISEIASMQHRTRIHGTILQ